MSYWHAAADPRHFSALQVIERDTHEHHRIKVSYRPVVMRAAQNSPTNLLRPSTFSNAQTTIPVHHTVVEAPIVHASVQHEPLSLKE